MTDRFMAKRVRVLYFLNSIAIGGVERHVIDLIQNADKNVYEAFLAAPDCILKELKYDLRNSGVETIAINIRSPIAIKEIIKLVRVLKKKKIEIFHSHLYYASRFGNPIAKLCGVQTVIETAHIEERWRYGWKKYLMFFDRISSLFADKIIAVSEAVKKFYIYEKKINSEKIVVVHNGSDFSKLLSQFPDNTEVEKFRKKFGLTEKKKIIAVVGRLHTQKGHTYLIDAAPEILRKVPNSVFLFAGDGDLKNSLKKQAKAAAVDKHIIFTGFLNYICVIYKIADILVLPSVYEGLPLTAIEASFMGCPVVATSVSGTPEIVLDDNTGILIPPRNPAALAEAVIRVLKDNKYSKKLAINAREHALKNFSIQKQLTETQRIYQECLRKSKQQRLRDI